jgi:hypothetical protein
MNVKKFIPAALAVGVAVNVFDYIVHGQILQGPVYSQLTTLMRADTPMYWLVIGDFVAAFVFVWVYDRVYGSFGGGPKGGAMYGLYAGILVNFPTWIFGHLLINGFTYGLAWIWTIVGILWGVVGGAVAGAMYKK